MWRCDRWRGLPRSQSPRSRSINSSVLSLVLARPRILRTRRCPRVRSPSTGTIRRVPRSDQHARRRNPMAILKSR